MTAVKEQIAQSDSELFKGRIVAHGLLVAIRRLLNSKNRVDEPWNAQIDARDRP
jgi:hypothetical protein